MSEKKPQQSAFTPPPMMGPRGRGPGGGGFRAVAVAEKPRNMRKTLGRLWQYFKGERNPLLVVMLLVMLGAVVSLMIPMIIGRAVDTLDVAITGNLDPLLLMAALLAGAYLVDAVRNCAEGFIMAGVSQRMVKALRSALFAHLQQLPIAFFDTHTHGDLMSRLTNDIDNISGTIASSASQLLSLLVSLVGALVMMLILSPVMTLALVVPSGLALLLTRTVAKKVRPMFRRQQTELGAMSAHIEESITGLLAVRAYNHEEAAIDDFANLNNRYYKASLMALIWSGLLMPMMNVINNLGLALVGGFGSYLAVNGVISVGIIATFISYSRQFTRPLNDVANLYSTLQTAIAGAERVFEIFDQAPETPDAHDAVPLADVRGDIIFEDVRFGYRPDVPVIQNVSFAVPQGASIALVGPTGAGKTTIVNLLARFYEIDAGSIRIDGRDIREYTRDSLRRAFGIVLQDTYLFSGIIRENIRYGNPQADDAQVERAAKMAGAHAFIHRLPEGYDMQLTESGSNLSGGQRQMLAIARAMLADSPILILDEATSSVDTRTELRIQEAMIGLMAGRTTFIIAHRLSTIRDADCIMVIDGGRIAEQGSHEELMATDGLYAHMWNRQLRNAAG